MKIIEQEQRFYSFTKLWDAHLIRWIALRWCLQVFTEFDQEDYSNSRHELIQQRETKERLLKE